MLYSSFAEIKVKYADGIGNILEKEVPEWYRHSLCHVWIDRIGLFAPVHLGHAHVALITLLGHILASVEEVGGFGRVLLHDGSKADFAFQIILESIPVRLFGVE